MHPKIQYNRLPGLSLLSFLPLRLYYIILE